MQHHAIDQRENGRINADRQSESQYCDAGESRCLEKLAKSDLPPIMTWKNSEGVTIKAGFGGIEGDKVVLKMPNGQKIPYPMAKLSPESQQQAKESAGQ